MSTKWIGRVAAGILAAGLAITGLPGNASAADPALIACATGTQRTLFNPGVKLLTPQTVTSTNSFGYGSCVTLPPYQAVNSGSADYTRVLTNFTCVSLLLPLNATFTITWNTGQTSNVTITYNLVGPTVVGTGPVNSGLFAGQSVTIVLQSFPITPPLDCTLSPSGLTQVNSVAILTII